MLYRAKKSEFIRFVNALLLDGIRLNETEMSILLRSWGIDFGPTLQWVNQECDKQLAMAINNLHRVRNKS